MLLFGDLMVFTVLFGVYLHARSKEPHVFATDQLTVNRNLGALNTIFLLCSSLLVLLAVRAVRSGLQRYAPRLVLGGMAFGLGFIVVKAFEYHEKFAAGHTPAAGQYYLYYFVLTGLHLGHLVVGMGVLTLMWRMSSKAQLSKTQFMIFEGGACFWHMVDLLWIMIFPLVYLVR